MNIDTSGRSWRPRYASKLGSTPVTEKGFTRRARRTVDQTAQRILELLAGGDQFVIKNGDPVLGSQTEKPVYGAQTLDPESGEKTVKLMMLQPFVNGAKALAGPLFTFNKAGELTAVNGVFNNGFFFGKSPLHLDKLSGNKQRPDGLTAKLLMVVNRLRDVGIAPPAPAKE